MGRIEWEIYNKLGEESGFGEVYLAKKLTNEVEQPYDYALKKLVTLDDDSIERFKREVRYLNKLDHPRIVKCEGYNLNNEPYFYTMKKYNSSLTEIQDSLSQDLYRLKSIYNNILEGIEYLHEEGYFHRDLKPGNVLINSDNDLALCDLGLCVNPISERERRITKTFMAMGSEFYCSPEQKESLKRVDHRTDIYSFGKMLYEVFTGKKPAVLNIEEVPPAIQYVIRKCTKEHLTERFNSVIEIKRHFNTAMDLLIQGDNETNVLSIINDLNNYDDLDYILDTNSNIDKLADSLSRIEDNEELHDLVMKINSTVLSHLNAKYPDVSKSIVKSFIDYTSRTGWPFSYIDTLAIKYQEIFINIDDIEIREELAKGLLDMAVTHNRWNAMGVFVDLLYLIKNDSEAYSMYHSLSDEEYNLNRVKSNININKSKLNQILKKLF